MRSTMKTQYVWVGLLTVFAGAACTEHDPLGLVDDQEASSGTIVGRIAGEPPSTSIQPNAFQLYANNGPTVAAARVRADGGLEALVHAEVAADWSYRIEGVPAGERIVVVATDGADEVGRVIVHQGVAADATATAAPIDGVTTLQALVFSEIVAMGMPAEAVNTVELAQAIRVESDVTSATVVASTADLRALADAFRAAQGARDAVFAELDIELDAEARFQAAREVAAAAAAQRHDGADRGETARATAEALAEIYRGLGADRRAQVIGNAAAGTALLAAADVATAEARLDIALAALEIDLLARERLISEALAALGVPAAELAGAAQGFASAASDIATSFEPAAWAAALEAAAEQAQAVLTDFFAGFELPAVVAAQLEEALANLPDQAELEARLETAIGATGVAQAYVEFFGDLHAAVLGAVAQLAGSAGSINGPAIAEFFSALRGFVSIN